MQLRLLLVGRVYLVLNLVGDFYDFLEKLNGLHVFQTGTLGVGPTPQWTLAGALGFDDDGGLGVGRPVVVLVFIDAFVFDEGTLSVEHFGVGSLHLNMLILTNY